MRLRTFRLWFAERFLELSVFGCAAVLALTLWVLLAFLEARSFERITGRHVSTWDAMFIQLRVQDAVEDPAEVR